MKIPAWLPSRLTSLSVATLLLFGAALAFGGASRLHELRLALVELAALPLLVIAGLKLISNEPRPSRLAMFIVAGAAAIPLIQLLPIPFDLWATLPGRAQARLVLELAGVETGWATISLTPDKTWQAFLAAIPPIAMFLGFGFCAPTLRHRLVYALLAYTVFCIVLGTAQLASGGTQLYPWPTTDAGNVSGMLANRNHLATLCLLAIPFAAVLGASSFRKSNSSTQLRIWLSVLFLAMMVFAIGIIRSRMGIALLVPTLVGSLLAAWVASGGGRPKPFLLVLLGGVAVAVGAVAIFALPPLLERFDSTGVVEGRFENWPIVAAAANEYLPLGSGIGSFDTVYRSVEPLEQLDATFFNQAHNDYLEIWLESGWMGAVLVAVFGVWFVRRTWAAWRFKPSLERDLQRAATVAIAVVLMHSAVDYPLRTETIAVIFAMCCALLEMARLSNAQLGVRRSGDEKPQAL